MCLIFSCIPKIRFVTFFSSEIDICFGLTRLAKALIRLLKYIGTGYLVNTTPSAILTGTFRNTAGFLSRPEDVPVFDCKT